MTFILVVGSLRNGRAGCSGPDRNGSRAAEPNEFDAGNVRGPDRGTRGGERRVEDPGGGSGSATADQLTELLKTTVHGRTRDSPRPGRCANPRNANPEGRTAIADRPWPRYRT